ncbi:MAG: GTP-binding protein [Dehalococcoidia bacterium]|nr:50S ribosome-binding GTPase [Dehalococcoidia bacterium]MCB9486105.1 50S ribosome-binding GTPase [Thermoflexaceae bacterium]
MDLLRIATAGSVDDGKSTLIGRLLYDSKQVFEDTMESLDRASKAQGLGAVNLALLTDGLRAEREQGITIDVAYRYFATPRRKFIIADSPGHVQYTRNMVTGASTAELALLLVDARKGVVEQTRRHAAITALLGIRHLMLCVNKMDLVNWEQSRFDEIACSFRQLADDLGVKQVTVIPLAAVSGDNVVDPSTNMPWYTGGTLLDFLETVQIPDRARHHALRFPVQYVIRPQSDEHHDYRGYAGTVATGSVRTGDVVAILPSGVRTQVTSIDRYPGSVNEAHYGQAVTLRLAGDIDISRGQMIVGVEDQADVTTRFSADVCWMSEAMTLRPRKQFWIRHTTRRVRCLVERIDDRLDVEHYTREEAPLSLTLNDIGRVVIRTMEPLFVDPYEVSRDTGSFILIDPGTQLTVAAGMVRTPLLADAPEA